MVFLWSLQEAFNKKLGGYIVKGENSGSIDSLMTHFTVGSLGASDLASINDLFNQYEENLSELPEVRVVDLTVDNAQIEQELLNLKQEALEKSEALKNSLAKIVLNEEERIKYEEEVLVEKNKLAQELSEASRANKKLKEENQNLLNLQSDVQDDMKSLSDLQKRRKDDQISFDIFKSLPRQEVQYQKDGELGSFGGTYGGRFGEGGKT